MKQSTILKSFLENKILLNTLKTGFLAGILISIPVFLIIFYIVAKTNNRILSTANSSYQSILIKSFENSARYGDIVNAKETIIQQGKSLGLLGLVICDENEVEVLPALSKNDCNKANAELVRINDRTLYLNFTWKKLELNYLEVIVFSLLLSMSLSIPVILFGNVVTFSTVSRTIESYSKSLAERALNNENFQTKIELPEFKPIINSIENLKRQIFDYSLKLQTKKVNEAILLQAKQVAHDIRSPLSVLNLLVPTLSSTENEKTELLNAAMKRVNDIAEELLQKSNQHVISADKQINSNDVLAIIQQVIKEKQLHITPNIIFSLENNLMSILTTSIKNTDLSRIISNLFNNSIEAMHDTGLIVVHLYDRSGRIGIDVTDNGKGIPQSIINKVGTEGFSFKKTSTNAGSGLGVFHAVETLKSIGGNLEIESSLEKGTKISLTL